MATSLLIRLFVPDYQKTKESLIQIFKPTPVQASPEMILALCATLIVKTWMALFYRKVGKAIASQVILAQAFDSLSDLSMSAPARSSQRW